MLRSLVLILLIVNAAFFAWSHGWLNQLVGVRPDGQHEPQRLAQQIHPDKITVLPPPGQAGSQAGSNTASAAGASAPASGGATAAASATASSPLSASAASTPASGPSASAGIGPVAATASSALANTRDLKCVEAGPFSPAELANLDNHLRPILPAGSWSARTVSIQGVWLVYMGPYADPDMLEHKQNELRRIRGLTFEEVRTPPQLAMGISLGRFNSQQDAEAGLIAMRNRGIRTARVVTVRPAMDVQVLRIPQATVGMQVSLASIKLPQGKGFSACRN